MKRVENVSAGTGRAIARPTLRRGDRVALRRDEVAETLGVSVDFFDAHIASEMQSVPRGRITLYPVKEVMRWLDGATERAAAVTSVRSR